MIPLCDGPPFVGNDCIFMITENASTNLMEWL